MEKLCKMAKRIDLFLKAIQIILIVFSVLIVSAFAFDTLSGGGFTNWSIQLNNSLVPVSQPTGWLLFFVSACIVFYGLHILRRILEPMKQGKPFAESVSKDMRRFGFIVLIEGGMWLIVNIIGQQARYADTSNLYLAKTHQIDITFLVVAAVVFLFSYIFRYGEELQRLSDETL